MHNGPETEYKGKNIPKVEDFLSNIAQDVTETKNVAGEHLEIVARLTKLHEEWVRDVKQQ